MLKSALIALSLSVSSLALASPAEAQTAVAKPAPADPVRLKLAEQTVLKLIPPGTYQKIMKDMMDTMAGGMVDQMFGMDASTMAGIAGVKEGSDEAKAIEGKSMADIAADKDPSFKERMDVTMKVMFSELGNLMGEMEPVVRTAMSSIYARKYSAKELTDMNTFFATPSGASFAGNFMAAFTDKEMIDASFGMMPKMMEAMPAIMKKVEAATAHLPPLPDQKVADDYSDIVSYAYLDGVPECAKDDDVADCSPEDVVTAEAVRAAAIEEMGVQAAADPTSAETGEEPWYSDDNWKPAGRKKVKALEAKYNALGTKSETAAETAGAAFSQFDEAQSAVIDEARKRYLAEGWKPAPAVEPAADGVTAEAAPPAATPS